MAVIAVRPLTATGFRLALSPPSPRSPLWLSPQAMAVPSLSSARSEPSPAEIAVTCDRPETAVGVSDPVPGALSAETYVFQLITVPLANKARFWLRPEETAVTPARPWTGTGTLWPGVAARSKVPHSMTVPLASSASDSVLPADIAVTPVNPTTGAGTS